MPLTDHLPRFPLAFLPTELHPLPRLSAQLGGPQLWVKRDDQTGLAAGGNKVRKLEFLIANALAQGADTILTIGAVQSNHCRQTAAAAVKAGLSCHLILSGQTPAQSNGNLLLDELLGAELHWTTRENRAKRLNELAAELDAAGHRAYPVTLGGSDPVGASGYAQAIEELQTQCRARDLSPDSIVVPSSSGGTQGGLVAGAWVLGWDVPILGISIDETATDLQANVADLATRTASRLAHPHTFAPGDIRVDAGYLGAGYSIMGDLEREAIKLMARGGRHFPRPGVHGPGFWRAPGSYPARGL